MDVSGEQQVRKDSSIFIKDSASFVNQLCE